MAKIIKYENSVEERVAYCIMELNNGEKVIIGWGPPGLTINKWLFGFKGRKIYQCEKLEELERIFLCSNELLPKIKGFPLKEKVLFLEVAVEVIKNYRSTAEIEKRLK